MVSNFILMRVLNSASKLYLNASTIPSC